MTNTWLNDFNKDFRDNYNGKNSVGIEYYDVPRKKLFDFITTLLEKQREEYVEMIEKYKLEQIDKFDGEYSLYLDDIINLIKPHDKTS